MKIANLAKDDDTIQCSIDTESGLCVVLLIPAAVVGHMVPLITCTVDPTTTTSTGLEDIQDESLNLECGLRPYDQLPSNIGSTLDELTTVSLSKFYQQLLEVGYDVGPEARRITKVFTSNQDDGATTHTVVVFVPFSHADAGFYIHPMQWSSILEATLYAAASIGTDAAQSSKFCLEKHISCLSVPRKPTATRAPSPVWIQIDVSAETNWPHSVKADIAVIDHDTDELALQVKGLVLCETSESRLNQRSELEPAAQAALGANVYWSGWKHIKESQLVPLHALLQSYAEPNKKPVIVKSLVNSKDDAAHLKDDETNDLLEMVKHAFPEAEASEEFPSELSKGLLIIPLPQITAAQGQGSSWAAHAMAVGDLISRLASRSTKALQPAVVFVGRGILTTPEDIAGSAPNGAHSGYLGLLRTARTEYPHLDLRLVDAVDSEDLSSLSWVVKLSRAAFTDVLGPEMAIRRGGLYLPRALPLDTNIRHHLKFHSRSSVSVDDQRNVLAAMENKFTLPWNKEAFESLLKYKASQHSDGFECLVLLHNDLPDSLKNVPSISLPSNAHITYASQQPEVLSQVASHPIYRPPFDALSLLPPADFVTTTPAIFDHGKFDAVLIFSGAVHHASDAAGCVLPGGLLIAESSQGPLDTKLEEQGLSVIKSSDSSSAMATVAVNIPSKAVLPLANNQLSPEAGCIVITGGNGGLGLLSAKHLISQGASRVVLLSRSGRPGPGCEQLWNEVLALGRSRAVIADVTDPVGLSRLREELDKDGWLPVRGVIHAAGIRKLLLPFLFPAHPWQSDFSATLGFYGGERGPVGPVPGVIDSSHAAGC